MFHSVYHPKQVRDYIHVMDLADGHVVSLERVLENKDIGDCRPLLRNYSAISKFHVLSV